MLREIHRTERSLQHVLSRVGESVRLQQEAYLLHLLDQERYRDPKRLCSHEHQVFSQHGEDGILIEIFRRIGVHRRTFVEIGAGDGRENNTAYLLSQGWTGFWVEGDRSAADGIRANYRGALADGSLRLVELFVTAENIASALDEVGVPEDIDLLSLDIDQNTYWVWASLPFLRARVAVVEYNATWPPAVDWKMHYDAAARWDGSLNFGASLKAYEILGARHGYRLVGCDLSGVNAFFVREDLCADHFRSPYDAETHYEPARYWLTRTHGHRRADAVRSAAHVHRSDHRGVEEG